MIDRYGLAVVQERTAPRRWDGLAAYLRQEYGPGTTPASLLVADGTWGGRRPGTGAVLARTMRRLARRLRAATLPGRGSRTDRRLACDGCAAPER